MLQIRKCKKSDESYIAEICYKTGYMREDLTNRGLFNDKVLFSYFFCYYYVMYETENCFVAEDTELNRPIGYIIGTPDTKRQRRRFIAKMSRRIAQRIISVTLWRYPETTRFLLHLIKSLKTEINGLSVSDDYPAHLHINILKEYQRMGIGEKLLNAFEDNISDYARGIHLSTTSRNIKAVPFYQKMGYKVAAESPSRMWKQVSTATDIIFVKKL